jgi:hypothetical protein
MEGVFMMRKYGSCLLILAMVFAGGCASQTGWTPTVDTYGDKNADHITRDQADCRALAQQASGGTGEEALKGTVVGGLLGAAAGAALGAAVGAPGTGAAMGAAAGGIGGGASQGLNAEEQYKQAFKNCMKNRGHSVIN